MSSLERIYQSVLRISHTLYGEETKNELDVILNDACDEIASLKAKRDEYFDKWRTNEREIAALKAQLSEQTELAELAKTTSRQFDRMLHKQAETIGQLEKVILDHGITMLNQIGLSGAEADALLSGTGYGDDDPAKIDWRKPLLTKVEVL